MASEERSPKRQRLSPPGDTDSIVPGLGNIDPPVVGQINGSVSSAQDASIKIPGLGSIPPAQDSITNDSTTEATKDTADLESSGRAGEDRTGQTSAEHSRTDHEREEQSTISAKDDFPFLRKKRYMRSRPHPSQDLVKLYKLAPLAATVARRDPNTGAKINKLRKSYEGKIKSQNLPGRNKPTSIENELMGLMEWPEEGWYDQRVHGRELEVALDPIKGRLWRREDGDGEGDDAKGKVERAFTLNVGRLPRDEDDKWRAILALDEAAGGANMAANKASPKGSLAGTAGAAATNGLLRPGSGVAAQGTGMRASAPASPAQRQGVDRPDRAGKKRRYDDASFEGYDGGWVEDDGYSTGDGRGTIGRKKRREFDGPSSAGGQIDQGGKNHGHFVQSSGGGMVGVRSS